MSSHSRPADPAPRGASGKCKIRFCFKIVYPVLPPKPPRPVQPPGAGLCPPSPRVTPTFFDSGQLGVVDANPGHCGPVPRPPGEVRAEPRQCRPHPAVQSWQRMETERPAVRRRGRDRKRRVGRSHRSPPLGPPSRQLDGCIPAFPPSLLQRDRQPLGAFVYG